jgi:hypothetical protein
MENQAKTPAAMQAANNQPAVRALSAQQILSESGTANMLSGRTIHIRISGGKPKSND